MNSGFTNLESFAVQLSQALVDIAPEALEIAVRVVRINAVQHLAVGLFLAVITALVILFFWATRPKEYEWEEDWEIWAIIGAIFGFGTGITSMILLLDVWHWIGLFNPELRLARDVLTRLLAVPN